MSKLVKLNSSNAKTAEFVEDFEEAIPGVSGGMKITFARGDQYIYYPMPEIVYDIHIRKMQEEGVSVGTYLKRNIQNLFKFKKL